MVGADDPDAAGDQECNTTCHGRLSAAKTRPGGDGQSSDSQRIEGARQPRGARPYSRGRLSTEWSPQSPRRRRGPGTAIHCDHRTFVDPLQHEQRCRQSGQYQENLWREHQPVHRRGTQPPAIALAENTYTCSDCRREKERQSRRAEPVPGEHHRCCQHAEREPASPVPSALLVANRTRA